MISVLAPAVAFTSALASKLTDLDSFAARLTMFGHEDTSTPPVGGVMSMSTLMRTGLKLVRSHTMVIDESFSTILHSISSQVMLTGSKYWSGSGSGSGSGSSDGGRNSTVNGLPVKVSHSLPLTLTRSTEMSNWPPVA